MTDYFIGMWHGVGVLGLIWLSLVGMSAFYKYMAKRAKRRLLDTCSGNKLLMETLLNAGKHSDSERDLWRRIAAIGPYTISFTRPGENPALSKEVLYGAITIKGLEHLVCGTDLDPAVIDGMIQTALEMAMNRVSSPKEDE